MNKAGEMLLEAHNLVTGNRNAAHGNMMPTFERIAALWSAYLGDRNMLDFPLSASEACDLMELMKIARRQGGTFNPDDYTDGAGYAACAFECHPMMTTGNPTRGEER